MIFIEFAVILKCDLYPKRRREPGGQLHSVHILINRHLHEIINRRLFVNRHDNSGAQVGQSASRAYLIGVRAGIVENVLPVQLQLRRDQARQCSTNLFFVAYYYLRRLNG
jgi:hypothetical protein